MSVYDLTQVPTTLSMDLLGNTTVYQSPLIGSVQTLDRGGQKWQAVYNYANVSKAKRAELMGLIARLRGQAHRLRVPVYDNPRRGNYGGTPLVDGASQTGSSLNIDGAGSVSNWIRAGDYFSVVVNGEHELKMCTVDATSSGGDITIEFEPRLRASPLNNAVIFVEDGGGDRPEGVFYLRNPGMGWTSRPFQSTSELSFMSFSLTEDVFATQ